MTTKRIEGAYGEVALAWGGEHYTRDGEVLVSTTGSFERGRYVPGPALRDALLEAFPLEEKAILHETEEECHDVVPGMVLRSAFGYVFTVLPDDGYYDNTHGVAHTSGGRNWGLGFNDVVFDPRGAKALPNQLGIRVGDRVRKTKNGITVAFEVGYIDGTTKFLYAKGDDPKFPVSYNPKGFEVVSREVPDRLPAGTIVRLYSGDLRLITNEGGIHLTGYVNPRPDHRDGSDYGRLVKDGDAEVIYLPES